MKNHSVLLLLLSFFIANTTFSQTLPEIVPPSPEAASLGKFSEVPVSHYAGLPNISIPISSFEVDGKSFPVSINYHARGIKVEEIASRVGIGWALNAGGAISRQTRGQPDDRQGGYINRSNILMDVLESEAFFSDYNARANYAFAGGSTSVDIDRFPDQFNISAPSISGKFIFSYKNDEPLLQSFNDIVIDYDMGSVTQPPTSNIIKSFVVTDKDGFKYYFGVSKDQLREAQNWDKTIGNYAFPQINAGYIVTSNSFELIFNSWLLMDVESPNGQLVSFIYEEETSTFFRRSFDKKYNTPLDPPGSLHENQIVNYTTKVESHQYQLKEILHEAGKIEFISAQNRQDLNGGKELDQVKVYDNNQNLVKTFELYQSYPNTVVDNNQHDLLKSLEPQAAKRVFLDSIAEFGKNNTKKPAHVFTYSEQELPNRFTNSQDLWGFYNGQSNGEYLRFFGPTNLVNRHVDVEKSMAGMLTKITYPTGGSTKFVFEHNIGKLGNEYDDIVFPSVNAIETKEAILSHFDHALYSNGKYSKDIVITNISSRPLRINVNLPEMNGVNQNWACGNPTQNDCVFDIRLEGLNGAPTYNYIFAGQQEFQVQSGEYKLIFDPDGSVNWNHTPPNTPPFSVGLAWEEELVSSDYLYSAGKRIKRIEFYDAGNNLVSQKTYSYEDANGNQSGIILSIPSFGKLIPNPMVPGQWQPTSARPGSGFSTFQGNAIGYQRVTEYHGTETNNNGKTEYEFLVQKDTGDYTTYPITVPTDNEWLRGLIKHVRHYSSGNNGTYKLVKNVRNDYMHANQYLLPLIFTPLPKRLSLNVNWTNPGTDLTSEGLLYDKTRTFFRLPLVNYFYGLNSNGGLDINDHKYKIYHLTGGTLSSFKSIETLYDDNENVALVTETETEFNYQKHYQPAKVTSVTSDGKPVIQTFTYPQDTHTVTQPYSGNYSSNPLLALSQQNRVVPVITKDYKDTNDDGVADSGELLNTTETTYAWDNNVLKPSLVQTGKGSTSLIDRVQFKDYDSDGNLLQVSKAAGPDITYIYGYDKTIPVAKIENATYAQVSSQVTNIQIKSNLDNDSCMDSGSCNEKNLRTALNVLRDSLPNAMVTTYTYDPLIGMTSMTDSKGYTVYYEYDDLNRLLRVKDDDGKILSENQYYYVED